MSSRARVIFAFAALLAVLAYVLPLWNVYLQAPQYPEGLGLRIWISTVTGMTPNDLNSINNLNHYIGMKRIVPEAIPELRLMPYALGALVALGLLTALRASRRLARVWVAAFLLLAIAGLADFWKWEYDYGHDLDMENAIIKVPGMNYQPPLIGTKQLLNFSATSLPASGAIVLGVSLALGLFALISDRSTKRIKADGRAGARAPVLAA